MTDRPGYIWHIIRKKYQKKHLYDAVLFPHRKCKLL